MPKHVKNNIGAKHAILSGIAIESKNLKLNFYFNSFIRINIDIFPHLKNTELNKFVSKKESHQQSKDLEQNDQI